MASVTAKLVLTSPNVTSDDLSVTVENLLTVGVGGVSTIDLGAAINTGTARVVAVAANYTTPAYVYMRNKDTGGNTITIEIPDGTAIGLLKAGEFTWIPWTGTGDIAVFGSQANMTLEWGIFTS